MNADLQLYSCPRCGQSSNGLGWNSYTVVRRRIVAVELHPIANRTPDELYYCPRCEREVRGHEIG